jgi:hypothetical protein
MVLQQVCEMGSRLRLLDLSNSTTAWYELVSNGMLDEPVVNFRKSLRT